MKFNEKFKVKKYRYLIISFFITIIIIISVIGWNILITEKEFKVTVLNLSGKTIMAFIFVFNNASNNRYFNVEVTTNGLNNNASRSFNFRPLCKEFTVLVETRNFLNDTTIAHAFHYFHSNEIYDLLVIVQNSGENVTITKMP